MGQCLSSSPGAELSRATLAGDFDEVSRICSAWPRAVLHQATFSGRTPLHDAADAGSTVALAILVEALGQATGGDRRACAAYIGHPDSRGRTALLLASRGGHQQCVQLLLEEGASPLPADRRWNTALGEACRGGHASTAETLLSARLPTASGGHVAAAAAVVRDSMGDVRWVDAHNRDRLSSLHLAVLSGSVETVTVLAERHGAALDSPVLNGLSLAPQRCGGSTPLHLAAHLGYAEITAVLLRAESRHPGLEVRRLRNLRGMTPLSCALRAGHHDVGRLLIERGAPSLSLPLNLALPAGSLHQEGLRNHCLGILNRTNLLLQLRDLATGRHGGAAVEVSAPKMGALQQLLRHQVAALWAMVSGLEAALLEQQGRPRGWQGADWRASSLALNPAMGPSRRRQRARAARDLAAASSPQHSAEQAWGMLEEYVRALTGGRGAGSAAQPAAAPAAAEPHQPPPSGGSAGTDCTICMDSACAVALGPCGHAVCFGCACQLCAKHTPAASPSCPFCRGTIASVDSC